MKTIFRQQIWIPVPLERAEEAVKTAGRELPGVEPIKVALLPNQEGG